MKKIKFIICIVLTTLFSTNVLASNIKGPKGLLPVSYLIEGVSKEFVNDLILFNKEINMTDIRYCFPVNPRDNFSSCLDSTSRPRLVLLMKSKIVVGLQYEGSDYKKRKLSRIEHIFGTKLINYYFDIKKVSNDQLKHKKTS